MRKSVFHLTALFVIANLFGMASGQDPIPEWEEILRNLRAAEKRVLVKDLDPDTLHPANMETVRKKYSFFKTVLTPPKDRAAAVQIRTALRPEFSADNLEKQFAVATNNEKREIIARAGIRAMFLGNAQDGTIFFILKKGKQPTLVFERRSKDDDFTMVTVDKLGEFGPGSSMSFYVGKAPLTAEEALSLSMVENL